MRPTINRKAAKQEIEFWRSKFRVLEDWKISYYSGDGTYVDQCFCNIDVKKATIYAPSKCNKNPDYFLHEVLHVMFCAVRNDQVTRNVYNLDKTKESEEQSVHDLCNLVFGKYHQ